MRRTACRHSASADESGFEPGTILIAVHNKTGQTIEGTYTGLSTTKKTLKIGEHYVSPSLYTITLKQE